MKKQQRRKKLICIPNRENKIAESAYYKWESRDFEPGHDLEDWYQAELEYSI
jgi:hypothetical protein